MSKEKEYSDFVNDMVNAANDIISISKGRTFEEFDKDIALYRGIERLFEIIGEAANRIPRSIQNEFPQIPWTEIISMRNRIIHAYDRVDPMILWDTITNDLPTLLPLLNNMLLKLENNEEML